VIRPTQEAYEVACTQNWHQTGNFVTLRKQKNKEMKRSSGLCSHGMPTRLPSLWRKEHGSKAAWRAAKQLRDTRSDPCPQIVRLYAKASEPRMERKSRRELQRCSVSITSSWVPLVCAEFDADNFDRVTAVQDWSRHRVPSGMQSTTNPSPRRDGTRSRGPADIQSWRRC
jgi:hypothetical protein